MTTTQKTIFCLTLTAVLMVVGCSKTEDKSNWHIGQWSFDGQMTVDSLPAEMKESMPTMALDQMVAQMSMGTITFTATTVTFESPTEEGETQSYKVQSRPDANTLVLENEDGQVVTLRKVGEHMVMDSGEDNPFTPYLKRVQ